MEKFYLFSKINEEIKNIIHYFSNSVINPKKVNSEEKLIETTNIFLLESKNPKYKKVLIIFIILLFIILYYLLVKISGF